MERAKVYTARVIDQQRKERRETETGSDSETGAQVDALAQVQAQAVVQRDTARGDLCPDVVEKIAAHRPSASIADPTTSLSENCARGLRPTFDGATNEGTLACHDWPP